MSTYEEGLAKRPVLMMDGRAIHIPWCLPDTKEGWINIILSDKWMFRVIHTKRKIG